MARFDKKWLFVHVPAGVATVALIAFGLVQCSGKNEYKDGLDTAADAVKKAEETLKRNIAQMDSLLVVSAEIFERNAQQADSIVVLNDSIDTLNGQVSELTVENDALSSALKTCKGGKKKVVQPVKKESENNSKNKSVVASDAVVMPKEVSTQVGTTEPAVTATSVAAMPVAAMPVAAMPVATASENAVAPIANDTVRAACLGASANICLDAAYNNGNIVIDNGASETDIRLGNGAVNNGNVIIGNANSVTANAKRANIEMSGGYNNGNVVVESAPSNATIAMDSSAVNNGAIIVGNANTVYHVLPDTVARFSVTKNTVVKCRVVAKQRQYR